MDLLKFKKRQVSFYIVAFIIVCIQLYMASKFIVTIPIVDGWPVWNRVMQLDFHDISWLSYLFSPHGAHPHSIVYLIGWLDFHYGQAQQYIMMSISFLSTSLFILFIVYLINIYSQRKNWQYTTTLLLIIAVSFLITNLNDTETIMQPFQVVMSFSRLAYIVLLWFLIKTLSNNNLKGYILIVFLSSISVTFHGSGYIFACLFILIHILLAKNKWMIFIAFTPMLVLGVIFKVFANGGGEISQLARVLSIDVFISLFKAICAYYATPINNFSYLLGNKVILFLGFILFISILWISINIFIKILLIRLNYFNYKNKYKIINEHLFIGVIGTFILLSSFAAAAFMIVRGQLFGGFEAYEMVLATHRYGAYASLSYILLIIVIIDCTSKIRFNFIISNLLSITMIVFSVYSTCILSRNYTLNEKLNIATTGLAIGLSPINPEVEIVWPSAKDDWYWVDSLPLTVAYLHSKKKSIWSQLPDLFSLGNESLIHYPLKDYLVVPVDSDADKRVCKITGIVPINTVTNSLSTIVNQNYEAIGFVSLVRQSEKKSQTKFQGYVLCDQSINNQLLYIMDGKLKQWKDPIIESIKGAQAYNLTNDTFVNGIARNWSGFFLEDTKINKSIFCRGRIIRFEDGTLRTIIRQESTNGYLNIFTNGAILNGTKVGYPYSIKPMN